MNYAPTWITIPAGAFSMGSDPASDAVPNANESPRHRLTLDPFQIARTPVTNTQYEIFVRATGYPAPGHWLDGTMTRESMAQSAPKSGSKSGAKTATKATTKSEGTWKLSEDGFCSTWKGSKENCYRVHENGANKWAVVVSTQAVAYWSK